MESEVFSTNISDFLVAAAVKRADECSGVTTPMKQKEVGGNSHAAVDGAHLKRTHWDIVMGEPGQSAEVEDQLGQRKELVCIYCKRSFGQVGNLNKHVRTVHFGLRPYSCKECGKKFSQKSVEKNHFRAVHLREKPFSCETCKKNFSDKNNLRKHIRLVHLKERRYSCPYDNCTKKFGEKRSLKDHISSVHEKRKPHLCPHSNCDAKFGQKSHLSTHLKTRHHNLANHEEYRDL